MKAASCRKENAEAGRVERNQHFLRKRQAWVRISMPRHRSRPAMARLGHRPETRAGADHDVQSTLMFVLLALEGFGCKIS